MPVTSPPDAAALAAAFAPTGRLRASINLGNPILAHRDAASGAPAGVSVDLAQALGERLGLPVDLAVFDKAAQSVTAVRAGQADIGFFAIDPARSEGLCFSAPYLLIEGSYLVPTASALQDNAQVDTAGRRIGVASGSAYDLHLSRALQAATIERFTQAEQVRQALQAGALDVAAGIRQMLEDWAQQDGGLRLLPGRFMVIQQAMGLPAARGEAAHAFLTDFVESQKSSGFIAQALTRHGVQGASVAPAA